MAEARADCHAFVVDTRASNYDNEKKKGRQTA